ncbi:lipopolysaccharide biosynthesis protein [Edaphobacter sp. HDX4]|uniref:lipopolysaccharide biosynthesis protein n=1 Tax=Edaphobacter sp. HDX4 TaxID=2794064 RepID=UPI002FE612AC
MRPAAGKDLHLQIQRSLLWTGLQHWGIHAIKFAVLFLLARYISPVSLGIYALGGTLVSVAQLLSGQGMMAALVQRHNLEDGHKGSAFLSMLVWSLVLAGVLSLGGRALVHLLSKTRVESQVVNVVQILAWSLPLNAISNISVALWRRDLAYKRVAFVTTSSQLVGSLIAVVLAIKGMGVKSLIARQLAEALMMAVLCISAAPWRLLRQSSWRRYREIMRVAAPVGGINLMLLARTRVDELLIGFWLGAEALGYYALARRQIDTVSALVPTVIGSAFSPILSRLQKDERRLRIVIERGTRLLGIVVFPAFAAVASIAGEWMPAFLGPRWTPAVPLLQAFALIAAFTALLNFNLSILLATGYPRIRFVLEAIMTGAVLCATVAALPWGTKAIAYASALAVGITVPLELTWIARRLPMPIREQLRILWPSLLTTMAMVAVLVALQVGLAHRWSGASRLSVLIGVALFFLAFDIGRSGSMRKGLHATEEDILYSSAS